MESKPYKDATQIADRITRARHARGYGMRELARRIGVGPGRIAWLESGRANRIGVEIIAKIADALDVPRAWLAWGEGDGPRDSSRDATAKSGKTHTA